MDSWAYLRANLLLCVALAEVGAGGKADNNVDGRRERVR
jgi:hypothetical protein